MIDFSPISEKQLSWPEFAAKFNKQHLIDEINELTDIILDLVSGCTDYAVSFAPHDPAAHDPFAENPEDEDLGWNFGHLIAHITASNEESAFLSAELARGVTVELRRSRYEPDWKSIATIEQARQRLRESRRMVLACLDIWPDQPHLENFYESHRGMKITPVLRLLLGLNHASGHLAQIHEVIRQARASRNNIGD